jgi:cell division protease FtsH
MVARWGTDDLGLVEFQADEGHPFLGYELAQGHDYSEATAARIDQEVRRLLAERHAYAGGLLTDVRELLDHLRRRCCKRKPLIRTHSPASSAPVLRGLRSSLTDRGTSEAAAPPLESSG